MEISWSWITLTGDSRGNRLEDYRLYRYRHQDGGVVMLQCCEDVAKHAELALRDVGAKLVEPKGVLPDTADWTFALRYRSAFTREIGDRLELLKSVLTLRPARELALALALDFYKKPPGDGDAEWTDTDVGSLVNRGKYRGDDSAGTQLADRLAGVIRRHPSLRAADRVVAVPGTEYSFGERLAAGVAKRLDLPHSKAVCDAERHGAAKAGHEDGTLEPYHFTEAIAGEVVIIIDDVFRTGRTMRSIALAATEAGARAAFGVVGARTRRN